MIRLNQSSTKRRTKPRNAAASDVNSISDLLGPSAADPSNNNNDNNNKATTPESDRLFLELLGDDSSGMASKQRDQKNKDEEDDASSAMSSLFSGLLDKYRTKDATTTELGRIPESHHDVPAAANHVNNSENDADLDQSKPKLNSAVTSSAENEEAIIHPSNKSRDHPPLHNLLDLHAVDKPTALKSAITATDNEEDTLITKPREISFDPASDDVSALFGGGGVSTANGVESYMGTYAKQRKQRGQTNNAGGGLLFGAGGYNTNNTGRRNEEASSSRLSGVDSILEDIGVRTAASRSLLADNDNDDNDCEENKGHRKRRHFRSSADRRKRRDNTASTTITDFYHRWKRGNHQTTLILTVLIVYVMLQIPTVQRHDAKSMTKLKSERHKYDRFDVGGKNYDDGTGDGHESRRAGMVRRERDENNLRGGGDFLDTVGSRREEPVQDSIDDMAIFSKRDTVVGIANDGISRQHPADADNQLLRPVTPVEHDDQKAALMQPPPDRDPLPSKIEKHAGSRQAADKLDDIDPIIEDPTEALPSKYKAFANVKTPYVPGGRDTPYFWHIPRSGGVIVKTLMSHCLRMTLAADVGELEGHDRDEELKVVSLFDHNYTNVNVASADGIDRAQSLGLVPSHLSDVIVSAQVDKVPVLFTSNEHARAFTLFRNPVDRAASMFYFLKGMGNERLKNMTLDDYAKSDMIENNWLVRILSDSMTGPIDASNLETAQQLLKEKFVVGILENKRGSFARFDHYFKWKENPNYEKEFGCIKQIMDEKYVPKHPLRKGDATWDMIFEQNRYDMLLYEYAKNLFKEQSTYIFGL